VTWGPRGQGGILSVNVYGRIWQKARAAALTRRVRQHIRSRRE
jgi:hypothetical protein